MKKKLVLIPSAYNERVLGDIENFIPYYKDKFDVYVITDVKRENPVTVVDGVKYVYSKSLMASYLRITSDYIIDAGTIAGKTKYSKTQKRISVWHGIPYKNMFVDLDKEHVVTALDYTYGIDLMVSPSKWYTDRFLRQSMLYDGEVLETSVSRTDSLFISDLEKQHIREQINIPDNKKILLYAPTFREEGDFALPFDATKLNEILGDEWVIVTKLHYLNNLKTKKNVIDVSDYSSVNNLLAIADMLITDYSSLLFDYSILKKPALLFQYDRDYYEGTRGFMMNIEDYIDDESIVFTEEELYRKIGAIDLKESNLEKIRETFYPHQIENSTEKLVGELDLDSTPREISEVIFLVNDLNQIGGVHTFISNLAKEFKKKYNAKIIVIGNNSFDRTKDKFYVFNDQNVDIKLSIEDNPGFVRSILRNTDGYIIACQYSVHQYLYLQK